MAQGTRLKLRLPVARRQRLFPRQIQLQRSRTTIVADLRATCFRILTGYNLGMNAETPQLNILPEGTSRLRSILDVPESELLAWLAAAGEK